MRIVQSECRNLDDQYLWKETVKVLDFLQRDFLPKKDNV